MIISDVFMFPCMPCRYVSEAEVLQSTFSQLVSGVIWLVRDGNSYIDESIKMECSDTEETGTLEYFSSVQSARTAIGHDTHGRIVIVQVDGKTGQSGYALLYLIIKNMCSHYITCYKK